eukprot:4370856-Lingulodinium_polyedra.AAC.1
MPRLRNQAIASTTMGRLASAAIILGDMHVSLDAIGVEGVMAMAGSSDLLRDAGPTCYPTSGNPSRIDR